LEKTPEILMKKLFITEKPSVAAEFAKALKVPTGRKNGYLEGDSVIVTWCVGHLITMSYPEKYDEKFRRWSLDTLPFLPKEFKYEVIDGVKTQFAIVSNLSGSLKPYPSYSRSNMFNTFLNK